MDIIGTKNEEFEIIEAEWSSERDGFCIGESEHNYVTWWMQLRPTGKVYYSFGHYHFKDPDAPVRSRAAAYADYHTRLADGYSEQTKWGY